MVPHPPHHPDREERAVRRQCHRRRETSAKPAPPVTPQENCAPRCFPAHLILQHTSRDPGRHSRRQAALHSAMTNLKAALKPKGKISIDANMTRQAQLLSRSGLDDNACLSGAQRMEGNESDVKHHGLKTGGVSRRL